MINVNEQFEFERDAYGWKLHEWREGKTKDGEPTRTKATSYYPTLIQVCNTVIDRTAGHASDLHEVLQLIDLTGKDLQRAIESV